jgi:hypothetical protein
VPTPPPSADICTIAPNSALCQVLSPPTASEPVKPVQQASTEVIKSLGSTTSREAPNAAGAPPPEDQADSKAADGTTKPTTSEKENAPAKKMYCN